MFAGHHRLKELTVIIDLNGFQAMGATSEIIKVKDLEKSLSGFGFGVVTIDGHNELELLDALSSAGVENELPRAVIAKTIKGHGVDFISGNNQWHYTRLNKAQYLEACRAVEGES